MLVLKWNAGHECKKLIRAEGINARIHLMKGRSFQFPESTEKVVRKQFSDALNCGYCVIEKAPEKKPFGKKVFPKIPDEIIKRPVEFIEEDR